MFLGGVDTFYSIFGHLLCQSTLLSCLAWLESLTDRTEEAFLSHLITVVTELEVLRPLMMTLGAGDLPVTVLALYAVLTAIAPRLHILLSD